MTAKRFSKNRLVRAIFGCLFAVMGIFAMLAPMAATPVYAEPAEEAKPELVEQTKNTTEATATETKTEEKVDISDELVKETKASGASCQNSLGAIGWLVCPTTGKISEAVDWLYEKIENVLAINPVEMKDGSPIYEIWKYMKGITNIVFIIFCLIMIYSQITGMGITNYGLKKTLPKLIVAAVLVNLSFLICSLAVDVSNIVGAGLRGLFASIEESTMGGGAEAATGVVRVSEMYGALAGGSVLAIGAGVVAFETGAIWMLIPTVLGAIVAVVIGLVTIAMRQAVVALLIMISPLAIVAYMLPNTDQWFKKWKDLFIKMLVFYPMFSLLFGASQLAGFAIIANASKTSDSFGILLGTAVQIFPLFFSVNLMKMSGTVLGAINSKLNGLMARPLAANRSWADSHRQQTKANTLAYRTTPSARLMQYLEKRKALRLEDTKTALSTMSSKSAIYINEKTSKYKIGEIPDKTGYRAANHYTRNAKIAKNQALIAQNAAAHTEHVLNNYGQYFKGGENDFLNKQSQDAFVDSGRAAYLKEIDDENDTNFLIDRYLEATKRDENGRPKDREAFDKYMASVAGPDGEQRLAAKIIAQAARVESKQRSEFSILYAKYGHNGYNKRAFRDWVLGYRTNDDGWAVDENGERLRNADGTYVELVQGDVLTKTPDKMLLYDKRDDEGLYFDFKDQNGNVIAKVHRGIGADGRNHDDAAFIKETIANLDIPIGDPINNIYTILAGVNAGDIVTPQGQNEIGLARYSTTIGRAMKEYKGNAAWAGAMFNSGIGNRQIKNSSQHAIWTLDSIVKTLKPGAFNTQNPASVEYITSILNPDNWDKIFTEEELMGAVNINNKEYGGENWILDDKGNIVSYEPVKNPTYEQRMNTLKRKLLFPAMQKILPAFDRLRTSNTADNQKPGTADEQYKFLKMVEEKWENNPEINFDPTLVDQDLQLKAKEFRRRKHDKDGKLLYAEQDGKSGEVYENLFNRLEETYDRCMIPEDLKSNVFEILNSSDRYREALMRFNELCEENPNASMQDIKSWFQDLDTLISGS